MNKRYFYENKIEICWKKNLIKDKLIEKMNVIYNESVLLGEPLFDNKNELLTNINEIEKSYNL